VQDDLDDELAVLFCTWLDQMYANERYSIWHIVSLHCNYRDSTVLVSRGAYQEVIFYYGAIETQNCLEYQETVTIASRNSLTPFS